MSYKIEDWDQSKYLTPQTNTTPEFEIVKSLQSAWIDVLKTQPSINSLAVLFAQITLECGPNLKYCKNFNIGNIKSLPNDNRYWTSFRCNEIINGVNKYYDPPNPICNFRAFKTANDGFTDYIQFLAQKKNYAGAWAEVIKGNPAAYVHQLKLAYYFTADESQYLKGVVNIFNSFIKKYANIDLSTHILDSNDKSIEPFTSEEIEQIRNQIGLTADQSIHDYFMSSRVDESDIADIDPTDNSYYTTVSTWDKIKGFFGGNK